MYIYKLTSSRTKASSGLVSARAVASNRSQFGGRCTNGHCLILTLSKRMSSTLKSAETYLQRYRTA